MTMAVIFGAVTAPFKAKRQKIITSVEDKQLGEEAKRQLDEVELDISQIVSNGVPDTSFLVDKSKDAQLWAHVIKLHGNNFNDKHDDFGVDSRIKSMIRALCEGCRLPLNQLVPLLSSSLQNVSNEDVPHVRLSTLVPIFVNRKNLGVVFVQQDGISKNDCNRPECLWVWECNSLDVFPQELVEQVKAAREHRNLCCKRFRILQKLKLAIKEENFAAQQIAKEQLTTISRKIIQERERRQRMMEKRPIVKRNEKASDKKTEEQSQLKPSNALLCWLKAPSITSSVATLGATTEDVNNQDAHAHNSISKTQYTESNTYLDANDNQKEQMKQLMLELPIKHNSHNKTDDDFMAICKQHREAWLRYFSFLAKEKRFYVSPTIENSSSRLISVEDVALNLQQVTYGDVNLKPLHHCRVFQMYDVQWKRPPMRLVVSKTSTNITPTNPLRIEPALDYGCDSDEEWFLQYDVDDVDDSGSETSVDEDDQSDWIVDEGIKTRQDDGVLVDSAKSLSESIKVYCMYKNWHWIIDGVAQSSTGCCNKQIAKENGITIQACDYGFGFEGYTRNPIPDLLRSLKGNRILMTKEDIINLLLSCHGQHTKKEDLILAFKQQHPFTSQSEIRSKFNKFMQKVKIDDTPHRWMVTNEATKLFNIRKQLDMILNEQFNLL